MITKEYCRCATEVEKKGLRRAATVKAAKLLGAIVSEGTRKLTRATFDAYESKVARHLHAAGEETWSRNRVIRTSVVTS